MLRVNTRVDTQGDRTGGKERLNNLQEEGVVKAGSLQPYLSAINSWHADMGLSKPAVGQAVNMLRRG